MTDDLHLDDALRARAHDELRRQASTVDVDAAFVAVIARLDGLDTVAVVDPPRRRVWMAAVAAVTAVAMAGGVALVARRGADRPERHIAPATITPTSTVAPPLTIAPTSTIGSTSTVTPTTTAAPMTIDATTTTASTTITPRAATAVPDMVEQGAAVAITPSGAVRRACGDIVTIRSGDGLQIIGQLDRTGWSPAPADGTPVTFPACQGATTALSVRLVVPADLPAGPYSVCLTASSSIEGCAPVTVVTATPSPPAASGPATPDVDYFGVRSGTTYPHVVVDLLAPDGTPVRTVREHDAPPTLPPPTSTLPDGSVVGLLAQPEFGRCDNRPIVRTLDGTEIPSSSGLTAGRSVVGTADGRIIATRDACPEGTRWGDPGTHWELVSVDASDPAAPVEVLQRREPDPALVWYDDGATTVVTAGEPWLTSASPDGRYVSFADGFHPDRVRWLLLDLTAPDLMTNLPSSCPLPGDIASPPQFVGNVIVVARRCASLVSDDEPLPISGVGDGVLRVDAVDLTTGAVVWTSDGANVGPNSYSWSAVVSARLGDDGSVWAILGADGGVEQRTRWFVLHGDDVSEITRDDYDAFAFDPDELFEA